MSKCFTAGHYRYGICPRCKDSAKTMVLDARDGMYTCMSCGLTGRVTKKRTIHPDVPDSRLAERLFKINDAAADIFIETLYSKYGKEALSYLTNRGLNRETIQDFRIGYANSGRFLKQELVSKGFTEDEMIVSGLFKANSDGTLYFPLRDRVIFCINDAEGRCIGFSGRVMDKTEPKYKNTPETAVFKKRENLFALDKARKSGKDYLILCEGQMDVISLHQTGFSNAVASLGTALTCSQIELIKDAMKRVILLYDTDAAGETATKKAIRLCKKAGLSVYVSNTLPCKDPDEFIRNRGPAALRKRLQKPVPSLEYEILHSVKDGEPDIQEIERILLNEDAERAAKAVKRISQLTHRNQL